MKINIILLLLASLIVFTVTEKFDKIEGTSGEFADIVVDSDGRWFIIKDKTLYHSLDKGKTLNKIEIPSKEPVHTRLGIDKFNNVYVQDDKMTVFIVAPAVKDTFVFEEVTLSTGKEKLVSRPIAFGYNLVYFATKSGIMSLKNSEIKTEKVRLPSRVNNNITQMVAYTSNAKYFGTAIDGMFYSGGSPKHWVFEQHDFYEGKAVLKSDSPVKGINAVNDHIYCVEEKGKKKMNVVVYKEEKSSLTIIDDLDVTNINSDHDFIIHSPMHGNKTYVYTNIDGKGTLFGIEEEQKDYGTERYKMKKSSTHTLDASLLCATIDDNKIYFGTSDGVYQLTDIQSKN